MDERKLEAVPDLPGAVLLNQPEPEQPAIEDLTFVDVTGLAWTKATDYLNASEMPAAKREYALAKTALEDAVMRFNRARTMELGVFHVTDTEDPQFLQVIAGAISEVEKQEGGETHGSGA